MPDPNFQQALAEVLGIEGGYSNIAADRGGKTNWGITETLARDYAYQGEMNELSQEEAEEIYRLEFWESRLLQLDLVAELDAPIARELFEQAVNTGTYGNGKRCQRVLNVLNRGELLFPDLKVDGWLGDTTRKAIKKLIEAKDSQALLLWLNIVQGCHYFQLCEGDHTQEAFARGWGLKRVILK